MLEGCDMLSVGGLLGIRSLPPYTMLADCHLSVVHDLQ